jgi:NAD-dependent deacetylase
VSRGFLIADIHAKDESFYHSTKATATCDVFFSTGTSGQVYPAASLVDFARSSGATVAVINPDEQAQAWPSFHKLNRPAGQILPKLVHAAWPEFGLGSLRKSLTT